MTKSLLLAVFCDTLLPSGVVSNGHVRCPWHGACFNIRTGDIEDFPGLDSVQKFDVSIIVFIIVVCNGFAFEEISTFS